MIRQFIHVTTHVKSYTCEYTQNYIYLTICKTIHECVYIYNHIHVTICKIYIFRNAIFGYLAVLQSWNYSICHINYTQFSYRINFIYIMQSSHVHVQCSYTWASTMKKIHAFFIYTMYLHSSFKYIMHAYHTWNVKDIMHAH